MLELVIMEGGQAGEAIRLDFETAWFGKQPACDFVLRDEGVSRVHFSIVKRGEDYVLVDNKSTNGTFVNRLRTQAVTLRPGYVISAGACIMQVRPVAATSFRFVVEKAVDQAGGQREAQVFPQNKILLGRKSLCQVHLNSPGVSPVHAELELTSDGLWLTDQSSGAGVHVNGQRVLRQRLADKDRIAIRPYLIAVTLKPEMCLLRILRLDAVEAAPGSPLALPAKGPSRPSDSIAALPDWQQEKAPIYVPSTDILPNRFRNYTLLLSLLAVLAVTAYAWVGAKGLLRPAPVITAHAIVENECASCHTGFTRTQNNNCQACHADYQSAKAHTTHGLRCASCHAEHKGAEFDFAKSIGATCQSAGCHSTVHVKLKAAQTDHDAVTARLEAGFLGDKDHGESALVEKVLKFTAAPKDSAMHTLHTEKSLPCETCHAEEDRSVLNQVRGADGKPTAGVEPSVRRQRCMACHGFGPDATLQARCIGCHFEHPAEPGKRARFVAAAALNGPPPAPPSDRSGVIYLLGALAGLPLVFGFGIVVRQWADNRKALVKAMAAESQWDKTIEPPAAASLPVPIPVPQAHLRPRIDLDLCVGCASCVHVCPFNVLEMVDEKAKAVRMDDCTGYAACVAECPTEAIVLVDDGTRRTQELPVYNERFETNVPGLYLAGEVTGKALIKHAINGGKSVAEAIIAGLRPHQAAYDVIVAGAGPAGTSAALALKQANLRVLLLEQGTMANTINTYPRQKFVMAEPVMIPLAGPLWMQDASKEELLERWEQMVKSTGLVINTGEKVLSVSGQAGEFTVTSSKGQYTGARVVVAIGRRGSPRKLGVPGEDLPKVAYNLSDAEAYQGKAICIVGGGDSGIEAAIGLARPDLHNQVHLIHRSADFSAAKVRNQKKIKKSIDAGRIVVKFTAGVTEIRPESVILKTSEGLTGIPNDFIFVMAGGEKPKKFLADCGIEFSQRALS